MRLNYLGILLINLPFYVFADILLYFYGEPIALDDFKDMPSSFGGEIPYEGLQAKIIYAEPADGCKAIEPAPPYISNLTMKWVALVSRNNCTFEIKIRNAQNALYDAVIVHNVGSDYTEEMSVKNTTGIVIPSVFIGEHDGMYLKRKFSMHDMYYILITPDAPFNINTHLLLPFAIVVGICFFVMVVFMVVKCIKDRRRQRRQRLPTSALNKMLIHKFQKGDPYETCAICLDDYVEGEKLRVLPCAHAYHSKCIDPWLTNNRRVCPVCKRRVLAADEEQGNYDSDTDDDTTPLVNPSTQNQTNGGGGTFANESEHVSRTTSDRLRNLREVARSFLLARHPAFTTVTDNHSINGETSIEVSGSSSDISDTTTSTDSTDQSHACTDDEVHVRTTPGVGNSEWANNNDVII